MKHLLIILGIIMISCNTFRNNSNNSSINNNYTKPKSLSITGNFNGDEKLDTLTQFLADSTGMPVSKIPIFKDETYDEIVEYYTSHDYQAVITMNENRDKFFGFAYSSGLYCLINLGDLNQDNRDEVAVVPLKMDYSRHSYCHIYSLCTSGWKELYKFSVHESAFDYTGDVEPVFKDIPEALELRNGEWRFYDYLDMEYETMEEVEQMKKLVVPQCNNLK